MKARRTIIFSLIILAASAFSVWWFGPWRIRTTLANGYIDDQIQFRIVQNYKDFAASGWVIGIYFADADNRWRLRWSRQADTPWKRASVSGESQNLVVTVETESEMFSITRDELSIDDNDEPGWSFPYKTSRSDMAHGLLHTTY